MITRYYCTMIYCGEIVLQNKFVSNSLPNLKALHQFLPLDHRQPIFQSYIILLLLLSHFYPLIGKLSSLNN
jgi:hypothetical protein